MKSCLVSCPELISTHFEHSNKIHTHNQARQAEIVLEKMWVTCNPHFCLSVTLFRMTVTDYWRTFCFSLLPCSADKCIAVGEFVNCITCNMLNNDESIQCPEYF